MAGHDRHAIIEIQYQLGEVIDVDKLLKAQLDVSEKRTALTALLDTEGADTNDIEAAKVGVTEAEKRMQAVLVAEGETKVVETLATGDAEARERRELETRAKVGDVFGLVINGGAPSGAMAELQQERGLATNEISIRQLMNLEHRAVTPAPGEVGQDQQAIRPYVFPQAVGAFLGVDMPVVAAGDAVFPVLTATLAVGTPAENAEQDETTGAFSADVLVPLRLQASFFYSREDRARFAGMDAALRMNLSDGLQDGLDKAIMQGTNGLLTGTNLANHNVSAITSYALYRSQLAYGRLTGDMPAALSKSGLLWARTPTHTRRASIGATAITKTPCKLSGPQLAA